jgi:hypothetical protein
MFKMIGDRRLFPGRIPSLLLSNSGRLPRSTFGYEALGRLLNTGIVTPPINCNHTPKLDMHPLPQCFKDSLLADGLHGRSRCRYCDLGSSRAPTGAISTPGIFVD